MAPRRGGGSSGGSSRGGSGNSLSDSPWFRKVKLTGTHFHDPNIRAIIILLGIFFLVGCGLAIWSFPVRKNNRPWRWVIFTCSIIMAIISLGNDLSYYILFDMEAVVIVTYFVIRTILNISVYLAEISLLGFVYIIMFDCLQEAGIKAGLKTAFRITSYGIVNILIALEAIASVLRIKYEVNSVINPSNTDLLAQSMVWAKLDLGYYAVFLSVAFEILASAVWIYLQARKREDPILIPAFLAFLIATPLMVRSLFNIGYTAASLTKGPVGLKAQAANIFFLGFCTILTYIGVLLIATRFKKEHLPYQQKVEPPQTQSAGPDTWANPQPAQQQNPYPQSTPYSGPTSPVQGNYASAPYPNAPIENNRSSAGYGNSHYSSDAASSGYGNWHHPSNGTPPHGNAQYPSNGYANPQYPTNDIAYQAQSQYNPAPNTAPPVMRASGTASPIPREQSPLLTAPGQNSRYAGRF